MFFRKKKSQERTLTGVRTVLSAAHRDQKTGQVHGHTWEIVAWFNFRHDQSLCKWSLDEVLKPLDHTCLPDKIAWGEQLARHVCQQLNREHTWCVAVDVNRPSEGIYARFEA